uniref:Na_H_Exchanger domain-containing protein n=1 Tax=Caenorhabditis tropicalis TaxID=1561998 RepID=A0A1I7TNP7_9PELO
MFFIDPNPHVRIYFMFYLSVLTLPSAYVVIFGNKVWMRIAFVAQLIRMSLICCHNAFYPIFVGAYTAIEYEGKHPGAKAEEILIHSTAFGALVLFISLIASLWEPAKLYQIYRLLKMLENAPKYRMSELDGEHEEEDEEDVNEENSASTYVLMPNAV